MERSHGRGPIKGNNRLVKQINRQIVLNTIRERSPISRAEIAKLTRLYPATVMAIVDSLEREGFLRRRGTGASSGGRHPVLFELNPRSFGVVAVDVRVADVRVALMDLYAEPLRLLTEPIDAQAGPGTIIPLIERSVRRLFTQGDVPRAKVLGLGVTFPGPLDAATGTVLASPNLAGWENYALRSELEERLGFATYVENDADSCAWAEKWFGIARDRRNLVFVIVDAGIGAGIIIGGELHRGRSSSGELGHMTVDMNGPRCNCGNFGCLEAVASGLAIVRRTATALKGGARSWLETAAGGDPDAITLDHVLAAADQGDQLVLGTLDDAARCIGTAVASLINVLGPEMVVLGGAILERFPAFLETVRETALRRAFPVLAAGVEIVPSSLKDRATLVGGAASVLMRLFRKVEPMAI